MRITTDDEVYELDWLISGETVVRPDVCVLCEPEEGEFITRTPSLIAEVLSPATAGKDRVHKRHLYAAQGVPFYLIVDPSTQSFEALRLADGSYTPIDGNEFTVHGGCTIKIDVPRLWDLDG